VEQVVDQDTEIKDHMGIKDLSESLISKFSSSCLDNFDKTPHTVNT